MEVGLGNPSSGSRAERKHKDQKLIQFYIQESHKNTKLIIVYSGDMVETHDSLMITSLVSVSSNVQYSINLEGPVLLVSTTTSGSYTFSTSFSTESTVLWVEGFDGNIPFRVECSKFSLFISLHNVWHWVSYFCPTTTKEYFSNDDCFVCFVFFLTVALPGGGRSCF